VRPARPFLEPQPNEVNARASGIQVIQEIGPVVKHLSIYQRTPNFCLPMDQRMLDPKEEERKKAAGDYASAFDKSFDTFAGFTYSFVNKNTFEDDEKDRQAFYDSLWAKRAFTFWLGTYKDVLTDEKANEAAYQYWRAQVLKRVKNKEKAALLAPEVAPHPFGTKRPSLEQNFYEVINSDRIEIIDVNVDPILRMDSSGIQTKSAHRKYDVVIFATGFDAVTGGLTQLNIRGSDGRTIKEHWADGVRTGLGIAIPKFPNLFFLYGPHGPTAFANGTTSAEVQSRWLKKVFTDIRDRQIRTIEPTEALADEWRKRVLEVWGKSLFPKARSWYQAANIPGKKVEALNWSVCSWSLQSFFDALLD
jgi:cation diffusion facilitator CzcD-associated flavoprotein CzcO